MAKAKEKQLAWDAQVCALETHGAGHYELMPIHPVERETTARQFADAVYAAMMGCSHYRFAWQRPSLEIPSTDGKWRNYKPGPNVSYDLKLIMPDESEGDQ